MPVEEVMTENVLTAYPNRSPEKSLAMMRKHKKTMLVIVDDNNTMMGIVSAYDVIKKMDDIKTIEEIMVSTEPFLWSSQSAKDAIIMMSNAPLGIIPVVDDAKRVVGLVTRGTLLSALSSQWTELEAIK